MLRIREVDGHALELGAGANQMAHSMGREALHTRLPVPLERRRGPGMPCLPAHNRHAGCPEAVVKPRCQEAGLQSNANEFGRVAAKGSGKSLRITRPLAAPNGAASLVDNMDSGLLVRDVEGSVVRHGTLQQR